MQLLPQELLGNPRDKLISAVLKVWWIKAKNKWEWTVNRNTFWRILMTSHPSVVAGSPRLVLVWSHDHKALLIFVLQSEPEPQFSYLNNTVTEFRQQAGHLFKSLKIHSYVLKSGWKKKSAPLFCIIGEEFGVFLANRMFCFLSEV